MNTFLDYLSEGRSILLCRYRNALETRSIVKPAKPCPRKHFLADK